MTTVTELFYLKTRRKRSCWLIQFLITMFISLASFNYRVLISWAKKHSKTSYKFPKPGHHTRGRNAALRTRRVAVGPRVAPINYGGHLSPRGRLPPLHPTATPPARWRTIIAAESTSQALPAPTGTEFVSALSLVPQPNLPTITRSNSQ